MKIFNIEKENGEIYVQINDILFLTNLEINFPKTIDKEMLNELELLTEEIKNKFIKFNRKEEIEFFKNAEYIIDYNEYINLSDEQLEAKAQQIFGEVITIDDKHKEIYKTKKHMIKNLVEIYKIKKGLSTIELPDITSKKYIK